MTIPEAKRVELIALAEENAALVRRSVRHLAVLMGLAISITWGTRYITWPGSVFLTVLAWAAWFVVGHEVRTCIQCYRHLHAARHYIHTGDCAPLLQLLFKHRL